MSDVDDATQWKGASLATENQPALFASLVLQQTNMALMFMGKVPHPESGQPVQDLEGATMFIDTLEMLEAKTKGNLTPEEAQMLRQSLMTVRMAFVEASRGAPPVAADSPSPASTREATETKESTSPAPAAATSALDDEGRKKFVKKY